MLAERVSQLKPSPTLALAAKVAALRRSGEEIVSFSAGEPDFDTPEPIVEAAKRAMAEGKTRYTPTAGVPELREAIAEKLRADNSVESSVGQVVVTAGAKQAIFNSLMALCEPGHDVVAVSPLWPTYLDQAILAGAEVRLVRAKKENGYVPLLEEIKEALTPNTRALIINTPNNPTGAVWPKETLQGIAELALQRDFYIISDEIYERHLYGRAAHVSIASLGPDVANRTITVGGVSKTFAMTGWRLGWSSSPPDIAAAMSKIQDQVSSGASSISQAAALAALLLPRNVADDMVLAFGRRRGLILEQLADIGGISIVPPEGAFYAFVDITSYLHYRPDTDVADHLLEKHKVACVPGSMFEGPGHLRLTYALSESQITEGVARIKEGLESLD
jgi:aspartate aminotransferase